MHREADGVKPYRIFVFGAVGIIEDEAEADSQYMDCAFQIRLDT